MNKLFGVFFGPIMRVIYGVCGNYGIALIVFTLFTKLLMLYWTRKSHISSAKMSRLSPKINKLKKCYANNQQKFLEEQQKLYKEEGYNQFAGCGTLFIQFPILFGVLDVVYRPITHILKFGKSTLNGAETILKKVFLESGETGYDENLAQYADALRKLGISDKNISTRPELELIKVSSDEGLCDKIFGASYDGFFDKIRDFASTNNIFGIDLSQTPTFKPEVWNAAAIGLALIPILSGVIQILMMIYTQIKQKKNNPDMAKQPGCMNVVLFGMPLFSIYLAMSFPAGVGFYWVCNSLSSFLITILLYVYYTPERIEAVVEKDKKKAKNKKPSRFQQMIDEQRALLEQQNGSGVTRVSDEEESNMSRSELSAYNRKLINEARQRMAEKYGEEYDDSNKE